MLSRTSCHPDVTEETLEELLARLPEPPPTPPDGLPLGNRRDPFAELIYILLTLMTRSRGSIEKAYGHLLELTDGRLDELDDVPIDDLVLALRPVGLVNRRAHQLRAIAAACRPAERFTEELRLASTSDVLRTLRSLPGVGAKTAKCVAMYSLDRDVLPVDIHVLRVAKRIGLVPEAVSWTQADALLETVVPAHLKRDVHVRFVAHGHDTCTSSRPNCSICPIAPMCPSRGTDGQPRRHFVG